MIQKSVNDSLDYSMESPRQKIIFVGDSGVGKTTMIKNLNEEPYQDLNESSIGIDFYSKKIKYKGTEIRLQIWDTAGQEKYRGLIPSYIRNAALIFLIYDISSKESFNNLTQWIEFINSYEKTKIVLCGNKIDLENERKVSKTQGEKFAEEKNMVFHEVSALENINMIKMFYRCIAELPYFDDKIDNNSREKLAEELLKENGKDINDKNNIISYNENDNKETDIKPGNNNTDTIHIYNKTKDDVNSNKITDNKKHINKKNDDKMDKKEDKNKNADEGKATSRSTFDLRRNQPSNEVRRNCPC